jgi:hypothetical protein
MEWKTAIFSRAPDFSPSRTQQNHSVNQRANNDSETCLKLKRLRLSSEPGVMAGSKASPPESYDLYKQWKAKLTFMFCLRTNKLFFRSGKLQNNLTHFAPPVKSVFFKPLQLSASI